MKKRLKILHKKTLLILLAIIMAIMPIIQNSSLAVANSPIWVSSGELQFYTEIVVHNMS